MIQAAKIINLMKKHFPTRMYTIIYRLPLICAISIWAHCILYLKCIIHNNVQDADLFLVLTFITCVYIMGIITLKVIWNKGDYTYKDFVLMLILCILLVLCKLGLLAFLPYFLIHIDINTKGIILCATNSSHIPTNDNDDYISDKPIPARSHETLDQLGTLKSQHAKECAVWFINSPNSALKRQAINHALDTVNNPNVADRPNLSALTVGVLMALNFQASVQSQAILAPLRGSDRHTGWFLRISETPHLPKGGNILRSRGLVAEFLVAERAKLAEPSLQNILN